MCAGCAGCAQNTAQNIHKPCTAKNGIETTKNEKCAIFCAMCAGLCRVGCTKTTHRKRRQNRIFWQYIVFCAAKQGFSYTFSLFFSLFSLSLFYPIYTISIFLFYKLKEYILYFLHNPHFPCLYAVFLCAR